MGKLLNFLNGVPLPQQKQRQAVTLDAEFEQLEAENQRLQSQVQALEAQVNPLKRDIERLKEKLAHSDPRDDYELSEIAPGVLAYALKSKAAQGRPDHYACANCMGAGHISPLQTTRNDQYALVYSCQRCNARLEISRRTPGVINLGGGGPSGWMGR